MPTKDEIIEQQNTLIARRNYEIEDYKIKLINLSAENLNLANQIANLRADGEEKDRQINLLNALNNPL